MKYLPLVWAGLTRKLGRVSLIFLQIVAAFSIFGVLEGVNAGTKQAIERTRADRLYVMNRVASGAPFPMALGAQLESIPGVKTVAWRSRFVTTWQQPNQSIEGVATNPREFFVASPELKVAADALEALASNRTGALIGAALAQRYGWKTGDRISLQSAVVREDGAAWVFDIAGIYTWPDQPEQANLLIVNHAYVNESRLANRNTVNAFVLLIDDPARTAEISHRIDSLFANSSHATRTQAEAEITRAQIQRLGDLDFIAHVITAAAFFALLTATGALLMQSFRERIPEFAVLKALGFPNFLTGALVITESLVLCIGGAAVGIGCAYLLLPYARTMIGGVSIPMSIVVSAVGFAVLTAAVTGLAPALRVSRIQVADALADR